MPNNMITGKTRVYGIIGDPIEHTVSPAMHSAAFDELGLNCKYVPFRVLRDDLSAAIKGIRALNIRGFNVTIPHKVTVIPYLNEIDPPVEAYGAVNTVVNEDGYLKGYNTDAGGFIRSLMEQKVDPARKKVVILGAGGAARAISIVLAEKGADITILNRHLSAAKRLAEKVTSLKKKEARSMELGVENLEAALSTADILINTTSAGMYPNNNETLVPSRLIKQGMVVADIVYNPIKTRLVMEAEKRGAQAISGLEMLIWQGAIAFELWTGFTPPIEVMRAAAIKALK